MALDPMISHVVAPLWDAAKLSVRIRRCPSEHGGAGSPRSQLVPAATGRPDYLPSTGWFTLGKAKIAGTESDDGHMATV
jgi:hypothetical protein